METFAGPSFPILPIIKINYSPIGQAMISNLQTITRSYEKSTQMKIVTSKLHNTFLPHYEDIYKKEPLMCLSFIKQNSWTIGLLVNNRKHSINHIPNEKVTQTCFARLHARSDELRIS